MNRRQRVVILAGCLLLLLLGLFPPYEGVYLRGGGDNPEVFIGYHSISWAPSRSAALEKLLADTDTAVEHVKVRIEMDRFWIGFVVCIVVTLGLVAVLSSSKPDGG